ncbi:MAG TPA: hypothetical protein VFE03_08775 [Caulobacteraceae bacterium]|nr:hypothetical protein [Caulobacteraceae bacterium]
MAAAASFSLASAQQYGDHITLPREVVAAAAAFQGYMTRAAGISASFKNPDAVYQGLKTGVGYEQTQLQQGMIGYGAIAALQDERFVDSVERAGRENPGGAQALVDQLLASPSQVMLIDGAQGAARRVRAALQRRAEAVSAAGRAVKQSAYDVQRAAWSKARVPNPQGRLAEVKSMSAARAVFIDGEEAGLVKTLSEMNRMSDSAEAPTPVMVRAVALAAVAVLGQARTADLPRLQPLLTDRMSGDCLKMAKLNLYQCMAVAGPHYEDIFCLGQHALIDTGQCVARATGSTAAPSMAYPSEIAAAAYRQASVQPPVSSDPIAATLTAGAVTMPRTLRAD